MGKELSGGRRHLPTGDVAYYEIRVKGHLDSDWAEWFEGMTLVSLEAGETLLGGLVADQAALHGLLARVRDLNLTLIAVNRIESRR